jgi:hypothetical protein
MSNDKMREEFEAWHKTEVANFVAAGQMQAARVLSEFKQTALAIWEASRAAVVVQLPVDVTGGLYRLALEDCTRCIEVAGLKVKP